MGLSDLANSYGPKFMTGDTIGCCLNIRNIDLISIVYFKELHSEI
ncbi:4433_t:CDS:2 [Funneliformis geosporum]|uniref:4433_t:CDS:1 n=1 Tax=Funneliformis geosporum TaxID=1117311 RepID=A0A9W4WSV3_9GLOM|nr:4433_t:CDS:2 [Funneliformis geosporum]